MAIIKPIIKAKRGGGAAQGKHMYITIFNFNDVVHFPQRDEGGVVMEGNIVFREGAYVQEVYATSSTISTPRTSEGKEDAVGFTGTPEFSHPGSSLEIEEFIVANTNQPLGVAVKIGACGGGNPFYRVYGSPCNPLNLIVEGQDNNEGVKDLMKFNQSRKSELLPGRYYGTWAKATANVVPADTTEIDVSKGSGEYQLQDNTSATEITNLINANERAVYTLVGSAGDNLAVLKASNPKFVLKADWKALPNSRITLKPM